ncbi:hypothetical protein [Actinacidiphila reveromycinica]|nr:hypothetical protein [Streptomyces sp. SN-593]
MAALTDDRRQEVCDWLTANGINPNDVPVDADVEIQGDGDQRTLRCEVYVTNEFGDKVRDETGNDIARNHIGVPLAVEPPEWWEPRIKPTREQLIEQLAEAREYIKRVDREAERTMEKWDSDLLAATRSARARVEEAGAQLIAVYRERAHLVAHLAAILPSTMADDPSDPDWRIVYLDTPSGQWSWHIAQRDLDLFAHVPDGEATWDGHTTDEKYQRVRDLTQTVAEQQGAQAVRVVTR